MKVLIAAVLLAGSAAGLVAAQEEPKAIVERACTRCHALGATTGQRNGRTRWLQIVDNMVNRGAKVSDDDFERVIDYLTKTYGPRVAVNTATAEAIAERLQISSGMAAAIVEYREKNGIFKGLDDLKKVPSIDAADIDRKKNDIDFTLPK